MLALIQRVSEASVKIDEHIHGSIAAGFMILLGIHEDDSQTDAEWLSKKILGLRIFSDEDGKMNRDVSEIDGEILLISQFTLYAQTLKGNRPSFIEAARPEKAIPLYEKMIELLEKGLSKKIQTGVFGADMKVSLINDGPVTISIDSRLRK
jgi:D-aminoacyl-tRNA deacylase